MLDPISNAPISRQVGPTQNRSQASAGLAGFEVTRDGLTSVQRVEAMQAAVEKLIKKNPPRHPGISLLWDEEGSDDASDRDDLQGDSDPQWPSAQLLKLRHYLKQMDGLLVDTEA
jgi:hypothetical protein